MNKYLPVTIGLVVIGAAAVYGTFFRPPAVNPDPNHTHADFAMWVAGTQLDFTGSQYMSEVYEEGQEVRVDPLRRYLHLHDGIGHIIHRHKPGLSLGEFLGSIGMTMTPDCITLDDTQFTALDDGWVTDFARTKQLCNDGKFRWTMIVNGQRVQPDPAFVFADTDKILLSYGSSDTAAEEQYEEMTDDACLYSRTCPERGDPPAENCIADPAVPCVIPE